DGLRCRGNRNLVVGSCDQVEFPNATAICRSPQLLGASGTEQAQRGHGDVGQESGLTATRRGAQFGPASGRGAAGKNADVGSYIDCTGTGVHHDCVGRGVGQNSSSSS